MKSDKGRSQKYKVNQNCYKSVILQQFTSLTDCNHKEQLLQESSLIHFTCKQQNDSEMIQKQNVSSDTDAPTAAITFVITKGHNSGKIGRRRKSFLYNHLHIPLDHMCKFERNPPHSLGEVHATRFGGCTDRRVQLYMPPTLWGQKKAILITG